MARQFGRRVHCFSWPAHSVRFVCISSACEEGGEERGGAPEQFHCLIGHSCAQTVSHLTALLVGRSVEKDDGENVQIPHAEDPCEESTVDLEGVVAALQVTFTHLERQHRSRPMKAQEQASMDHVETHSLGSG